MLTAILFSIIAFGVLSLIGGVAVVAVAHSLRVDGLAISRLRLAASSNLGLAVVSLLALWLFGLFDIGLLLPALFVLMICILSACFLLRHEVLKCFRNTRTDLLTFLLLLLMSTFLALPYQATMVESRITGGFGPDLTQNLMAISEAEQLKGNWKALKTDFLGSTESSNLYAGYEQVFDLTSMRRQALFDYLLFGTRWGFTLPFAKLVDFAPSLFPHIQVITLIFSLALGAFTLYSYLRFIGLKNSLSTLLAIVLITNSSLLIQFYNGGLAQLWALPSMVGFLCYIHFRLYLGKEKLPTSDTFLLRILLVVSATNIVIIYVDGLVGILLILIPTLLTMAWRKTVRLQLVVAIKSDYRTYLLIGLLLIPIYRPLIETAKLRSQLAPWAGLNYPDWMTPLEYFGLANSWIQGRSTLDFYFQMGFMILILIFILSRIMKHRFLVHAIELQSIFLVVTIIYISGLTISNLGSNSNYSFVKISSYLFPFLLILIASWIQKSESKRKTELIRLTLIGFTLSTLLSASLTNSYISRNSSYSLASSQLDIRFDTPAQEELEDYNYLTTFTPHSNLLGVFGQVHWISRPPNGMKLDQRIDRQMRVICLSVDNACRPKGQEILQSSLNKYGYRVFSTTITTLDFSKLEPKDRYKFTFEEVGQSPFDIPEEFIGTFRFRR